VETDEAAKDSDKKRMKIELSKEQRDAVDQALRDYPNPLLAIKLIREFTACDLGDAIPLAHLRLKSLRQLYPAEFTTAEITREGMLDAIKRLPEELVAIEAQWDGDTQGWFIALAAITRDLVHFGYQAHNLRAFGDAGTAKAMGQELAQHFCVAFYFPSPDHPEDQCPRWWEREKGRPCAGCGVLLLQDQSTPWAGKCYTCHLADSAG
jgi:hypothetical protein